MSASNNRSKDRCVRGNNDRDERGRKEDEVTIQIVKSVLTKIQAWNLSRLKKVEKALSHASSPQDLTKPLTQSLQTTSPQLQTATTRATSKPSSTVRRDVKPDGDFEFVELQEWSRAIFQFSI